MSFREVIWLLAESTVEGGRLRRFIFLEGGSFDFLDFCSFSWILRIFGKFSGSGEEVQVQGRPRRSRGLGLFVKDFGFLENCWKFFENVGFLWIVGIVRIVRIVGRSAGTNNIWIHVSVHY